MAQTNRVGSLSGYSSTTGGSSGNTGSTQAEGATKYWSLDRLKRSYMDYLDAKVQEVNEQKDARRYRHASQWTADQVKIFNKRKQPIVTYNRVGRKIDGVIGLIEKLKQSPKAFPRTPNEQGGAALATAVVRAVLDSADWKSKSYVCGQNAAIDGFAGIEMMIVPGDKGDPDISFEVVENDGFFYDPRSISLDFSDCRYMGMGKWLDLDQARELYPEHADKFEDAMESATDLSTNSDRENKWFIADGNIKRVRVVDEWYIMDGEWCWCQYTGNMKLKEGKSWFHDEKGKSFCKYVMFSAQVDQDGDRYGFVRNLKSAQDEINQRRSKALHLLNTRRIIAEQGAFDDVELTRREAARPDGVVIRNKGFEAEFDDGSKNQEIQAHLEFLVDAKAEIENFGPNPALVGQGSLGDKSGRAISLLQQAGIAELGPFLLAFRGWKIRLYRAIWNSVREHWRAERYVRVTDDQSVLQWVGINQAGIDPMTGMPAMVNQLGALDVDIIMDEGPDSLTVGIETYEALLAIAQSGTQVPPDVLIELHPNLDPDTKKRILEKLNAPNPQMQLQMQAAQAEIQKTVADTELSKAKAIDTMRGDTGGPAENPMVTMAELRNKEADTAHKKAQAMKTMQEAFLAPQQQAHEQGMDHRTANRDDRSANREDRQQALDQRNNDMDRAQNAYEKGADRDAKASSEADKGSAEERRLAWEREKFAIEREEREKDRQMQREEKENDRDYEADKAGIKRTRTKKAEEKAKSLEATNQAMVANLSKYLGQMAQGMKTLDRKMDVLASEMVAPVRIQRGSDGRVSQIRKGSRTINVERDDKGRIASAE